VVALDWKWLFIYPAEGVASLNQLSCRPAPAQLPHHLATVMNSFFVPSSQPDLRHGRMVNRLELLADKPHVPGLSAQYSGGFSDMRFEVKALPRRSSRLGERHQGGGRHARSGGLRRSAAEHRRQARDFATSRLACSRRRSNRR